MTAQEFRQKQDFEYEHFLELTDSGNKPDYYNIEQFAEDYHQRKLQLLGIANVVVSEAECEHPRNRLIMCGDMQTMFKCGKCGKDLSEH